LWWDVTGSVEACGGWACAVVECLVGGEGEVGKVCLTGKGWSVFSEFVVGGVFVFVVRVFYGFVGVKEFVEDVVVFAGQVVIVAGETFGGDGWGTCGVEGGCVIDVGVVGVNEVKVFFEVIVVVVG
jgi:hypothetical protein